jgi:Astacin (Peptidase family M12A)/Repeat of unknown function (DUF346)
MKTFVQLFKLGILVVFILTFAACGVQTKPEANSVLPDKFRQAEVTLPGFDKPQKVTYEIVEDYAIFEGDIILGKVDAEGTLIKSESLIDSQGIGTETGCWFLGFADCHWRWPNGVIPFSITGNWDDPNTPTNETTLMRNSIMSAVNHWQAKTGLRFVARTTEASFVNFVNGNGCSSWVGRGGNGQDIILQRNAQGVCDFGAIVHEIGHAVGLYHEQSREDRGNFVTILTQNIQNNMAFNFDKFNSVAFDIGSYDFRSIMHYGCTAFSVNGQNTIQPKNAPAGVSCTAAGMNRIGQRISLSDGDIAAANRLYPSYQSLGPALAPGSGVGTATSGTNNQYLDVFVRGTDNALYHRWTENGQQWSNWEGLGGVITSNPAAVGRGHRVDAFARGIDGTLWSIYYAGGWSNWYSLGGSLAPGSGASVVTLGNNTLNVFVRWSNNELYQRYFDGQNWGPWTPMGGIITSDPAAVVWGNYLNVFVRGTDNQLYYKHWNGQQWSNYAGVSGILTTGATAVSLSPNTLHVYARGTNGKLYENYWNGSQWRGWDARGNHFSQADPEAVTWGGRLNVFVRGTDGDLWYRFWNGSSWQPQIP